ncbi:type II secretion system GspH family protein [Desulfovibrio sp. JY]|nr:type II secretion system GspH family protein [Desulfovibrio sp. JY]
MLQVADRRKKGQQGFTLIEIIAVLVILGILAVVAVPKYIDLQKDARKSAAQGLVAAAQSQLSMGYAAQLLNTTAAASSPADECKKVVVSNGTSGGNVSCTGDSWKANVTIKANVPGGDDVTGYWNSPEATATATEPKAN